MDFSILLVLLSINIMAYSFVFYGICVFMNMCVSLSYEYHSCIHSGVINICRRIFYLVVCSYSELTIFVLF